VEGAEPKRLFVKLNGIKKYTPNTLLLDMGLGFLSTATLERTSATALYTAGDCSIWEPGGQRQCPGLIDVWF
jgi:hypothetical protein